MFPAVVRQLPDRFPDRHAGVAGAVPAQGQLAAFEGRATTSRSLKPATFPHAGPAQLVVSGNAASASALARNRITASPRGGERTIVQQVNPRAGHEAMFAFDSQQPSSRNVESRGVDVLSRGDGGSRCLRGAGRRDGRRLSPMTPGARLRRRGRPHHGEAVTGDRRGDRRGRGLSRRRRRRRQAFVHGKMRRLHGGAACRDRRRDAGHLRAAPVSTVLACAPSPTFARVMSQGYHRCGDLAGAADPRLPPRFVAGDRSGRRVARHLRLSRRLTRSWLRTGSGRATLPRASTMRSFRVRRRRGMAAVI